MKHLSKGEIIAIIAIIGIAAWASWYVHDLFSDLAVNLIVNIDEDARKRTKDCVECEEKKRQRELAKQVYERDRASSDVSPDHHRRTADGADRS